MRSGAVAAALAAILSALGASGAEAADMTPVLKGPGSTYIPALYNWTGFYLGVASGWGTGTTDFTDPFGSGQTASARLSGFLVGGVTGINYQIGSVVVGFEGDFIGSWAKGSVFDTAGNTLTNEVVWTSTVALRVGWAWDRLMIYAKGGGAFDSDRSSAVQLGGVDLGSTLRSGWNVGGGVEYALTEHWIARFAYDWLKFDSKIIAFGGTVPGNLAGSGNVGITLNEFKAIIEYRF